MPDQNEVNINLLQQFVSEEIGDCLEEIEQGERCGVNGIIDIISSEAPSIQMPLIESLINSPVKEEINNIPLQKTKKNLLLNAENPEQRKILIEKISKALIFEKASTKSFTTSAKEIEEMRDHFLKHPRLQNVKDYADFEDRVASLLAERSGIDKNEIKQLYKKTFALKDLYSLFISVTQRTPEVVEQDSRWLVTPDNKVTKIIGQKDYRLLQNSRLIGLIPQEAVNKLRNLKIVVIGASVAASTIDLLVAMGAENITFVDPAVCKISGLGKMPGGKLADIASAGMPKADALMEICRDRNPYGNFTGYNAKAVLTEQTKKDEVSIYELLKKADLVIEVVDDPGIKLGLREFMAENYPALPLLALADVGAAGGYAWREKIGNAFNQDVDQNKLKKMISKLRQVFSEAMKNGNFNTVTNTALGIVNQIVKKDFPADHVLSFMFNTVSDAEEDQPLLKDWAQTGISSRLSASIAVMLILEWLHTGKYEAKTAHQENMLQSFISELSVEEKETLVSLRTQLLGL